MKLNIRTKVAFLVSLLIMGLVLLMMLTTEYYMESRLKQQVREQQLAIVSQQASSLSESLNFRQETLVNVASAFPQTALYEPQKPQQWLEDRIVLKRLFDHYFILDASGHAVADWPQIEGRTGNNYSDREWYQSTLQHRSSQFSKPRFGQYVEGPLVIITAPFLDPQGQVTGMLVSIIELMKPNILGKLAETRFGKTGYLQILAQDRTIIIDPDPERILKPGPQAGENPALDRALAGFDGTDEGRDATESPILYSFKHIEPTGWLLVAALPKNEAFASIIELKLVHGTGAVLFMLVAAGLVSLLISFLLRPLITLRNAMDALRLDEATLLPYLPVNGSDELAKISQSFNVMADTLRQRNIDLHDSEHKLREITASLGFGVYALDADGRLIFFNPAAEALLGWNEQEALGKDAHQLFHHHKIDGTPYPAAECPVHQSIARGVSIHLKQDWLIQRDGTPLAVEFFSTPLFRSGKPAGAVAAFQDVSSRLLAENRIQRQATLDGLTGLVNRRMFMDRLNQAIYLAHRNQRQLVLLMLDLDGFKPINDNHGHVGGDQLLRQVARRLSLQVRQSDTVARLGGDEFAILLLESDAEAGQIMSRKILDAVAQPFSVNKTECHVGVSIGMAIYPQDASRANTLLIAADTALYASKAAGKHCVRRAEPAAANTENAELLSHRPLIEWTDDCMVGITPIDNQHLILAQHINAIETALIDGASSESIATQCDALFEQAKQHFSAEETLMQSYGVQHMGEHKMTHHALLTNIAALKTELLGDTPYLALPQLRDWLLDHIQHEDMQQAVMMKKNGYTEEAISTTTAI